MGKHIDPKPTTFMGVKYRSRLEARWAVFLAAYEVVRRFTYEAFTYTDEKTRWEYTPDFSITIGRTTYLLEVKPTFPTAEALDHTYCHWSSLVDFPLFLGYGNFFQTHTPRIWLLPTFTPLPRYPRNPGQNLGTFFPGAIDAINKAKAYRFDIR
jgi:hypothetical protein